jgi:hypothetical protein
METIHFLLKHTFRIIFILILVWLMLWLLNFVFPGLKISSIFSTKIFSSDWLPAPKQYGLLGENKKGGMYGTVFQYQHNAQPSNVDFIVYTASGTQIIKAKGSPETSQNRVFTGTTASYSDRASYLRNLSLYEGWNISQNSTYIGEASEVMFKNGTFPIFILDNQNRIVASSQAVNTGTWATPGWARFQFTIATKLPRQTPCTLVFMSSQNTQIQIRMNVRCN